jgi:hypothetical protein
VLSSTNWYTRTLALVSGRSESLSLPQATAAASRNMINAGRIHFFIRNNSLVRKVTRFNAITTHKKVLPVTAGLFHFYA